MCAEKMDWTGSIWGKAFVHLALFWIEFLKMREYISNYKENDKMPEEAFYDGVFNIRRTCKKILRV